MGTHLQDRPRQRRASPVVSGCLSIALHGLVFSAGTFIAQEATPSASPSRLTSHEPSQLVFVGTAAATSPELDTANAADTAVHADTDNAPDTAEHAPAPAATKDLPADGRQDSSGDNETEQADLGRPRSPPPSKEAETDPAEAHHAEASRSLAEAANGQLDERTSAVNRHGSGPETNAESPERNGVDAKGASLARGQADDDASDETNRPTASSEPAAGDQAGNAPFGQRGLPAGVADVQRAFIKTLPLAAKSESAWHGLPIGSRLSAQVVLLIDGKGRLTAVRTRPEDASPVDPLLARVFEKNRLFLQRGRYGIMVRPAGAGSDGHRTGELELTVEAVIEQQAKDDGQQDLSRAMGLRHADSSETPTGAYLTFYSGRHVEFTIERVSP